MPNKGSILYSQFYKTAARLAQRHSPQVAAAWLKSITKFKANINEAALAKALASKNLTAVEAAVKASSFGRMMQSLEDPLKQTAKAVGEASAEVMQSAGLAAHFNAQHANVILFARDQSATLVKAVTAETREAIRTVIALGAQEGLTIQQQASAIREVVGLPPNWVKTPHKMAQEIRDGQLAKVMKRRMSAVDKAKIKSAMQKGTVTEQFIAGARQRYAATLVNLRAQTIARTESLRAAHFGQNESWVQAMNQGVLGKDSKRVWLVTPDERLSEEHARIPSMNPNGRGMTEPFDTPDGACMYPPSRPNCRCGIGLIPGVATKPTAVPTPEPTVLGGPSPSVVDAIKAWTAKGGPSANQYPLTAERMAELREWTGAGGPVQQQLYRIISMQEDHWLKVGKSYTTVGSEVPGFEKVQGGLISWSKSADRAPLQGGDVFVRFRTNKLPQGRDITQWSLYPEEQEVLGTPGKFRVTGATQSTPGNWIVDVEPVEAQAPTSPETFKRALKGQDAKKHLDEHYSVCPLTSNLASNLDGTFAYYVGNARKTCTPPLSEEEKHSVRTYQSIWYQQINPTLRKGFRGGVFAESEKQAAKHIRNIDAVLERQRPLDKDIVVWRGSTYVQPPTFEVGQQLVDDGYMSTTLVEDIARGFAPKRLGDTSVMFRINVPKGTRGLWMNTVVEHSTEEEFLLQRGTVMNVKQVTQTGKTITVEAEVTGRTAVQEMPVPKAAVETLAPAVDDTLIEAQAESHLDEIYTACPLTGNLLRQHDGTYTYWVGLTRERCSVKLSSEQLSAVRHYQDGSYSDINGKLRRGALADAANWLKEEVKHIDDAIDAQVGIERAMYVWRGTRHLTPGALSVGERFVDKGFLSTSARSNVAKSFAGYGGAVFRLKIPQGTKGIWMRAVSGALSSEDEFLLAREAAFVVTRLDAKYVEAEMIVEREGKQAIREAGKKAPRLLARAIRRWLKAGYSDEDILSKVQYTYGDTGTTLESIAAKRRKLGIGKGKKMFELGAEEDQTPGFGLPEPDLTQKQIDKLLEKVDESPNPKLTPKEKDWLEWDEQQQKLDEKLPPATVKKLEKEADDWWEKNKPQFKTKPGVTNPIGGGGVHKLVSRAVRRWLKKGYSDGEVLELVKKNHGSFTNVTIDYIKGKRLSLGL